MELDSSKKAELLIETPKVLIADDNPAMRDLLRSALTQWGYQVVEAKDGQDAWEKLQLPDPPHLLILDWLMSKMDGIALCERIRKHLDFHPYIIFLAHVTGETNIIRGIEAGADEFLMKPVNFADLRTRVFAGERIIEYQRVIEIQKKQLQDCSSSLATLQNMLMILINGKVVT